MKTKQQDFFQTDPIIVRKPMSEQKVYYGLHYRKIKDEWIGERLGCHCKKVMLSLVNKWKTEIDSDGFFMGEITGNTYPEIPKYETLKQVTK